MEILEKELVQDVKTEKQILTDKCFNCGSSDIVPINDYKRDFGGEETHNGVVCSSCGCFHYLEEGNITYEYNYNDILFGDDKVEWSISDN